MEKRVYNFSAGPATLPSTVLEQAQRHLMALPGAGMSVLELSHRSSWFEQIIETSEANLRQLLNVPQHYKVLFLQGGASLQFSMLAINFLRNSGKSADYIVTGSWGKKAVKEARREGSVNVVWDGQTEHYARVPKQDELNLNPDATYVHLTSNETIEGVQYHGEIAGSGEIAGGAVPLICDMSSDFISRPIDVSRYAMIYAGAQKNAGGSGVTLVIIRDDLLERVPENMHSMMDYRLMAEKKSLYNTPPSFAIYIVMLVTRWLLDEVGGLEQMAKINREKALILYDVIDQSGGFYRGHAQPDSRSAMNVTWRLSEESLEQEFLQQAQACDLYQLKGHRSVGGIRASLYNAMPTEGVKALRDFMAEFQKQHA